METETFVIEKMKDINSALIDFLDATGDSDSEFKILIEILDKHKIIENHDEVRLSFLLISKIADNHHRSSDFFDKLMKIFPYLIKDAPSPISYYIPDYNNYNKGVLFHLLDNNFVKPDKSFLKDYLQNLPITRNLKLKNNSNNFKFYYLYPKLKYFLEEKTQKQIEAEILNHFEEDISIFEKKCQKGENDSYICSLIRSDSVEEFISYTNRNNFSLLSIINPSIYETNSFLIDKKPTFIEYATFFGAIQIIQYLKYNKVPITFSLWCYAVHSNNAELIHLLEENIEEVDDEFEEEEEDVDNDDELENDDDEEEEEKFEDDEYEYKGKNETKETRDLKNSFDDILVESIKCHHNDISNYIKDNFYEQVNDQDQFYDNFNNAIASSLNFFFMPESKSLLSESRKIKRFKLSQILSSFTQIFIPSSILKIGSYAFSGCSSLTRMTIPSSVTSIGNNAFEECSSLTQIEIPPSVTEIGSHVFNGIKKLEIRGDIKRIQNCLFSDCSSITQITIPSSVTKIGDSSFSGCSSLTQITIPSSVGEIGDSSFSGCSSLTQITIPSSITEIRDDVFRGCSSLTQITIPSSVTEIGWNAFNGCSSLIQITIPSSITSINDFLFEGCSSLTQITIPSSVTSIGTHAFSGCSSLTQITIPSSVTEIGYGAFFGCILLSDESLQSINDIKSK